ncbi:MAG: TadE family protein [Planctomycetota bacterium]
MNVVAKSKYARRGTTVVEMAVVAPLFIMLLLGMIELGYAFMVKQTVTLAAREGARAGALPGGDWEDIEASVDAAMAAASLPKATTATDDPSYPPIGDDRDGYVINSNIDLLGPTDVDLWVEVEIPLNSISLTGSLFGSSDVNIGSTTSMRREGIEVDG